MVLTHIIHALYISNQPPCSSEHQQIENNNNNRLLVQTRCCLDGCCLLRWVKQACYLFRCRFRSNWHSGCKHEASNQSCSGQTGF